MAYVYVIFNIRTNRWYIGFSRDVEKRVKGHQFDDPSWQLVYFEAYASEADARMRERKLKQYGSAWGRLKKRIQPSVSARMGGRSSEPKPQ